MTALPTRPAPTHAMIILEMLGVAARVGMPWVHQDDIARRLYPQGRPKHYAESIRSTVQQLRRLLAEQGSGIVADGRRYAIALDLPGVFRSGVGFVRRPGSAPRRAVTARHAAGAITRASR